LGEQRLAAGKKNAARLKAWLAFIDESGVMMAPLVRRSWSPRGHTPVLVQRTRTHQKVSIIAALCVTPKRDRVHLYFRLHANANVNAVRVIGFLRQLCMQIDAPIVLIWDRLRAHRAEAVRTYLATTPLHDVLLPPYAPEFNPIEYCWAYLKHNPLANAVYLDCDTLADATRTNARSLQHEQALLRSFIHHSPLSLRLR
jgi:transposase